MRAFTVTSYSLKYWDLVPFQKACRSASSGREGRLILGGEQGIHRISVTLIPSTYNTYGPHHYYEGDRHLISAAQYSGEKNFADRPDAPEVTKVPQLHFVRLGLDG